MRCSERYHLPLLVILTVAVSGGSEAPRSRSQLDPNAHPDSAVCPWENYRIPLGLSFPRGNTGLHIDWPCPLDGMTHAHRLADCLLTVSAP